MNIKLFTVSYLILCLMLATPAMGQQPPPPPDLNDSGYDYEGDILKYPWVFLGAGAGAASLTVGTSSTDEDYTSGYSGIYRTNLAWYWPNFMMEVGGGFSSIRFQGSSDFTDGVVVGTNAGFVEYSARLRLWERFQVGPVFSVNFGTDVGYDPEKESKANASGFAGLEMAYEHPLESMLLRFFLQGEAASLRNRKIGVAQLGFQIGFPLDASALFERDEESPGVEEEPLAMKGKPPVVKKEVPKVKVNLDSELIRFDSGKATINDRVAQVVAEFGEFLAANGDAWTHLLVIGHTDVQGSARNNMELSFDRALTITTFISEGGVNFIKMATEGLGESKPLLKGNSRAIHAKNRRVELQFYGVSDAEVVERGMQEFQRKLVTLSKSR